MARDIQKRLTSLSARRLGIDRTFTAVADSAEPVLKSVLAEDYQKRAQSTKPYTKYSLGAMQEVGATYTRISRETAERVGRHLERELTNAGYGVEFRLQGSVPLNTHIRGASDVDILCLDTNFRTYRTAGVLAQAGYYGPSAIRTSAQVLSELRRDSERVLKSAYPAATVDTAGAKAIKISGASLPRAVDVVPAHWLDTIPYQKTRQEQDRGVEVLDKYSNQTLENLPFLHIKRVDERDSATLGSLKKAIRLCKNLKSDAEDDGKEIALSSYEIAAILYHADSNALAIGSVYELQILAETQRYLDWLYNNQAEARELIVPDGSRRIFDSNEKIDGLLRLSVEVDDLLRSVAQEQDARLRSGTPSLQESRQALSYLLIPAA